MSIYESGQMYLETIYILSQKKSHVRAIDVGEQMGYSKPSVSRALSILKRDDYVSVDDTGGISLTAKGMEVAKTMYTRHTVLSQLLMRLGVDEKTATEDACKIEHVISEKSFAAKFHPCDIKHHAKTILPLWDEPSDDFLLSILRNHQSICAILVLESKSKESRVYSTSERTYICCDLKSLYISMGVLRTVWAPLATNLTVAYLSRTEKAIVLTVISFCINLIGQESKFYTPTL